MQVALCCSVPAHWLLLKSRLEKICPRTQGAQALWRWNSRTSESLQHPFLLQVTSYNREGVLHGQSPIAVMLLKDIFALFALLLLSVTIACYNSKEMLA